jgi:MFS family permease
MGVGVGEASSTSPSISLIGDYFPKDKRPIAMSIFNMAPTVGLYMGFMIGGLAAHYYGWRVAFFFAGIPGIIAAILLRFTVKEPIRGLSDGPRVDVKFYSMGETLRYFGTNKTFLLVMGGAIMAAYTNFSLITWNPSFFRRVHHLNMAQIGLYVGTVTALAGIIGAIVCGTVTTALGKRDDRWKTATPGIACVIAGPLLLLECLPDSVPLALLGVASGFFLCGASVGLQLAIVQTVVKVRMRAFAASLHFMASNLFGMALAPLIIGILNDAFSPRYGVQAVRYSMLTVVPASILAGLCLIYGARFIRGDIKTALEEGTEGKPTSSG